MLAQCSSDRVPKIPLPCSEVERLVGAYDAQTAADPSWWLPIGGWPAPGSNPPWSPSRASVMPPSFSILVGRAGGAPPLPGAFASAGGAYHLRQCRRLQLNTKSVSCAVSLFPIVERLGWCGGNNGFDDLEYAPTRRRLRTDERPSVPRPFDCPFHEAATWTPADAVALRGLPPGGRCCLCCRATG